MRGLTFLFPLLSLSILSISAAFAQDSRQLSAHQVNASEYSKEQKANPGKITRYYLYSKQLDDTYAVDVWVPADYEPGRSRPYPVIYAQDGQNLFDPTTTWNGQSWDLDAVLGRLETTVNTPVIVGIHNRPTRSADYLPHAPLASNPSLEQKILKGWGQSQSRSDRYLDFLVNTIKPLMENDYNIRHDAAGVIAMGSSMGGLISLYAMCEYPQIFGQAICMSTHWLGLDYTCTPDFPEAMLSYIGDKLPADGLHRRYLDHGTLGFDGSYEPWDTKAYRLALDKGYEAEKTVMHYIDKGADHNETCWSKRVDRPLRFMLDSSADIQELEMDTDVEECKEIYSLDGKLIDSDWSGLATGLYLIRTTRGSAKIMKTR